MKRAAAFCLLALAQCHRSFVRTSKLELRMATRVQML